MILQSQQQQRKTKDCRKYSDSQKKYIQKNKILRIFKKTFTLNKKNQLITSTLKTIPTLTHNHPNFKNHQPQKTSIKPTPNSRDTFPNDNQLNNAVFEDISIRYDPFEWWPAGKAEKRFSANGTSRPWARLPIYCRKLP